MFKKKADPQVRAAHVERLASATRNVMNEARASSGINGSKAFRKAKAVLEAAERNATQKEIIVGRHKGIQE